MSKIPSLSEARELMQEFNSAEFHRRHAETVSGVMGYFAKEYDPTNEEYWRVVGMLHDLDFEQYPDEHCVKCVEIMREKGIDEGVIRSCASHGFGMTGTEFEPELPMEKALFAVEELTGLIGAVALMRPSKSVSDLEVKSVKKKFKQPSFAAGCSRETIQKGADMLAIELDALIDKTILAMRELESQETNG